ncbi:hypothetical protein OY671_012647, partial [Metschnikowia pulcherrima]
MRARRGEFDIVVAQYHDQGSIPVKYSGSDQGVNVTSGSPFVRTSPDHGTAFDSAGTGRADEASFAQAVRMARVSASSQGSNVQAAVRARGAVSAASEPSAASWRRARTVARSISSACSKASKRPSSHILA